MGTGEEEALDGKEGVRKLGMGCKEEGDGWLGRGDGRWEEVGMGGGVRVGR